MLRGDQQKPSCQTGSIAKCFDDRKTNGYQLVAAINCICKKYCKSVVQEVYRICSNKMTYEIIWQP